MLDDGLDILNLYLKDRGELSLKALSSLLATELSVNVYQAKDILDYVWQFYNRYRYGYDYNDESETFIKQDDLYEQKEIPEPSETEFWFGVEKIAQFSEYLGTMNKTEFSVGDYRRYVGRMLKKKVRVQSMIRYLWNYGVITFVDASRIVLHLEVDLNISRPK